MEARVPDRIRLRLSAFRSSRTPFLQFGDHDPVDCEKAKGPRQRPGAARGDSESHQPTKTPPVRGAPPKTPRSWKVPGSAVLVKFLPKYTRTFAAEPSPLPAATSALWS